MDRSCQSQSRSTYVPQLVEKLFSTALINVMSAQACVEKLEELCIMQSCRYMSGLTKLQSPHHDQLDVAFLGKVSLRPLLEPAGAKHINKWMLPNCITIILTRKDRITLLHKTRPSNNAYLPLDDDTGVAVISAATGYNLDQVQNSTQQQTPENYADGADHTKDTAVMLSSATDQVHGNHRHMVETKRNAAQRKLILRSQDSCQRSASSNSMHIRKRLFSFRSST